MFNFDVLVNGTPVKRYYDRSGQIWIEGRKSTSFTLRVKNNSYGRILGIVSVDGLNVIDGKHVPIEDSRGYVVNSNSSVNIPGWKINQDEVREFYFTINGHNSYVRKIGADERNIGVIAAAVYKEAVYLSYTYTNNTTSDVNWDFTSPRYETRSLGFGEFGEDDTPYIQVFNMSSSVNQSSGYIRSEPISSKIEKVAVGSGARRDFKTHKTDFERGKLEGEVIIYYDTWEGLKRRGVLRDDREYRDRPRPFPNSPDYCPDV